MLLRKAYHRRTRHAIGNDLSQGLRGDYRKISGIVQVNGAGDLPLCPVASATILRKEYVKVDDGVRRLPLLGPCRLSRQVASRKQGAQQHHRKHASNRRPQARMEVHARNHALSSVSCCASTPSLSAIDQLCWVSTFADLKTTYPQTIPNATWQKMNHGQSMPMASLGLMTRKEAKISAVQIKGVTIPPHSHSKRAGNIGRSTA